jgi:hypothetical protein
MKSPYDEYQKLSSTSLSRSRRIFSGVRYGDGEFVEGCGGAKRLIASAPEFWAMVGIADMFIRRFVDHAMLTTQT